MLRSTNTARSRGGVGWRFTAMVAIAVAVSSCGSDEKSDSSSQPTDGSGSRAPVSVDSGGTDEVSLGDRQFIVVQSVVSNALGAGLTMDEECVAGVVAQLSDADLVLLSDALGKHDDSQPELSAEGEALSSELGSCAAPDTLATNPAEAGAIEDVCALVDPEVLAQINNTLGTGTSGQVIGPYGAGNACEFSGDAGSRVTVTITRNADVAAWDAEINDADGMGDGQPLSDVGDAAAVGVGFADAIVGGVLVEVSYFPSFDVAHDDVVQALTRVVNSFSF